MLTSRVARDRYNFPLEFFRPDGRLSFPDYTAARRFVVHLGAHRADPLPASDIFAMYLLDEALHIVTRHFHSQKPDLMGRALGQLQSHLGTRLDSTLAKFTHEFPPLSVYKGEVSAGAYLALPKPPIPDGLGQGPRSAVLQEMVLVNIANDNPAVQSQKDLFDDSPLRSTAYDEILTRLPEFLKQQTVSEPGGETLLEALRSPSRASPYSLEGQLQFILQKWGFLFDQDFIQRLMRGMDFIREDVIRKQGPGQFKPEVGLPNYQGEPEYERYSPDREWMPRLVLIAKNTYVWLDQLSKKHQRWIRTLDEIPDEELDLLARRGFTGLWLIGLWERSRASQIIKQRMGQEDAVASAYSLHSYDIASDLGGWEALYNLRARAWRRGIRLSADMVPNHVGIDSAWVIEHPDWFLSIPYPPYPSYSFKSENLSDDQRVGIYLEDHYYDRSDAAVVFQRRDHATGDARYIYHGNDGTSYPWNDTAQLDYTKAEVREAVIQTILHVARNFPVIRFDAAMTLARKHIQRLWFPEPGAGGAIPSRAEHGIPRSEFEARMPNEFWREVVDRVAAEVPDTLLLAEAFWLLEGYFVRTLGMHRVYNSAFMHMLRDEDNAKYRQLIKSTLEFDPQILKRYVNFMNNPDEKSAIEQFGNGDKYFGIASLLSTLPGLPMFGHGQVEGFHEKYGMEYRRAKWEEAADEGLIRGHEWRIFPLLHRRYLFAGVEQFLLYDFFTASGGVNENVFAYSNRFDHERGLVIYHNRFADTRGWIRTSAAFIDKGSGQLVQRSLRDGLGLPPEGHAIFKDYVTQLEYIRPCRELAEKGLYVELGAYQCHVFMEWRFVGDAEWGHVCEALNGAGVPSMQVKWNEMYVARQEVTTETPAAGEDLVRTLVLKTGKKKPAALKKAGSKKTGKRPVKPLAKKASTAGKKTAVKKPKKTGKKAGQTRKSPAGTRVAGKKKTKISRSKSSGKKQTKSKKKQSKANPGRKSGK